ncbi:MAG: hypothetical protein LCH20_01035 [Proteobacteria bacterium]|nr:hypothetical protein [Pseudomonadota bacterium]
MMSHIIILNNFMAVSSINASYSVASVTRTKVQSKELVFAKAKISINGVSVQIGGNVEETARKINRIKDKTGVEARVVTNSSGVKTIQLVLKRGNSLRINDQDGVLKGLVGTTDKHLIKVIKTNGQSKVLLQYTNTQEHHNNTKELYLRSSKESIDSRKKLNNHEQERLDRERIQRENQERLDRERIQREQERLEQERLRSEFLEGMRRINEHRERIKERTNDYANGSLKSVLLIKKLSSTTPEVVRDVERWIGEAIRDYGLRERILLGKGEQLKTLISQEIINKRGLFASAIQDRLEISEKDTKDAVRIAISKLK